MAGIDRSATHGGEVTGVACLEIRRRIQAAFDQAGFEDSSARESIEEKILNNLDKKEVIELLDDSDDKFDDEEEDSESTEDEEDVVAELPLSKLKFDSDDDSYEEDQEHSQQMW